MKKIKTIILIFLSMLSIIACDTSANAHTVKFVNYDGTVLETITVPHGETAWYHEELPTRESDSEEYEYEFYKWDKSIATYVIKEDVTFTAIYKKVYYEFYTVKFYDNDKTYLASVKVKEGDTAVYPYGTPGSYSVTSGNYKYTYTFSGWSRSLYNVTSDMTVYAEYNCTESYIGGSSSSNSGSGSSSSSGKTEVINYLDVYGSGTYNLVETGPETQLGYYDGYFYLSHVSDSDGLYTYMVMNFEYNDDYAYATFTIEDYGITMFEADLFIYFDNHKYDEMIIDQVNVLKYTTDAQLDYVSLLMVLAASFAVNNASDYLSARGLSYIF